MLIYNQIHFSFHLYQKQSELRNSKKMQRVIAITLLLATAYAQVSCATFTTHHDLLLDTREPIQQNTRDKKAADPWEFFKVCDKPLSLCR